MVPRRLAYDRPLTPWQLDGAALTVGALQAVRVPNALPSTRAAARITRLLVTMATCYPMKNIVRSLATTFALTLAGCSTTPEQSMSTVDYVDVDRFMGDWYVIANIPTALEKGAHNAVESYRLANDGTIETVFTFRKDAFDGPEKRYTPRGFIKNSESNAEWRMRFIWPFKAEYLVIYLNDDYTTTVVGRSKRDYVWIMSRTPEIAPTEYDSILSFLGDQGYDTGLIRRVPQRWN